MKSESKLVCLGEAGACVRENRGSSDEEGALRTAHFKEIY